MSCSLLCQVVLYRVLSADAHCLIACINSIRPCSRCQGPQRSRPRLCNHRSRAQHPPGNKRRKQPSSKSQELSHVHPQPPGLACRFQPVRFVFIPSLRVISFQPTVLTQLRYAESSRHIHPISTRTLIWVLSAPQPTEDVSYFISAYRGAILRKLACGPTGAHEALLCYTGCIILLHSHSVFSTELSLPPSH